MNKNKLSLRTRKCLKKQLGEDAANEIYNLINSMNEEINNLRRNKVDVVRVVPVSSNPNGSPR